MARYSKKRQECAFAHICFCNNEPDYEEALKWYRMAALNKNKEAESKIKEIEEGIKRPRKPSLIQCFDADILKKTKNTKIVRL